jgi:serine/threonine protein kinase
MSLSDHPSGLPSALPGWSAVPSNSEADRLLINQRVGNFIAEAFYLRSTVFWPPLGHPTLLVLDFGLVKEQDAGLLMTGALVGTPAYLAPETIMNPERVDARTDLDALGAVGTSCSRDIRSLRVRR